MAENLSEIRRQLSSLDTAEKRQENARRRYLRAEDELGALLDQLKKEQRDVERLREKSLSSFVRRLTGSYEKHLAREMREEIAAKLEYDRKAAELEKMREDYTTAQKKLQELRELRRSYDAELQKRREEVRHRLSADAYAQYQELERDLQRQTAQVGEIDEAVTALRGAQATANNAAESLRHAEGWSTYDIWGGGGLISHSIKYSHIDKAEELFHRLSAQLHVLREELGDVEGLHTIGLSEISPGRRAMDFWFDNIFTDLSVRDQVTGNLEEVNRLSRKLREVESALLQKRAVAGHIAEECQRRQEDLLVSAER